MNTINQQLIDAFQFRYACKRFDRQKRISDSDFQTIIEAGRLSPSSWGYEPWQFLVVQNETLRRKLYPLAWGAQNSLDGASHFVIILARTAADMTYASDWTRHMMKDIKGMPEQAMQEMEEAYRHWQIHDFVLTESKRSMFDWAAKQTYIALANMMTAAALVGIDSCPIEGFDRQETEALLVREGLLDTAHFGVAVMAGFGYRGETPKHAKTRQAVQDVVRWIG